MRETDRVRLMHMLDAAREAVSFAADRARADLDRDRMLNLSLVHLLEIVGEAARRVSPESREQYPAIPWLDISDMRNRLAHGYEDINLDIVWQVVSAQLSPLITELERILAAED
jgi:uncharacterized protein with HEPN domain